MLTTLATLQPRELCLVYRFLTNAEIATASLVCRRWNWMLWRETEQSVLWMPRIMRCLLNNKPQTSQRLSMALSELALNRELLYQTKEDVLVTLRRVRECSVELMKRAAQGLWISGEYKYLMRTPNDWRLDRSNAYHYRVNAPDPERPGYMRGATYKVWWTGQPSNFAYGLVAFYGTWPADTAAEDQTATGAMMNEKGVIVYEGNWSSIMGYPNGYGCSYYEDTGRLQLKGHLRQSAPHGEAAFYRPDGTLMYDGNWNMGVQQGQGTQYHEDGVTPAFDGIFNNKVPTEGVWFNLEGKAIHRGTAAQLQQLISEYHNRHQCTYGIGGKAHLTQRWFQCRTCYGDNPIQGVCVPCSNRCHKGHTLVARDESTFYCDCGAGVARVSGDTGQGCVTTDGCGSLMTRCDCAGQPEQQLRFITDPNVQALTAAQQEAYLIALMLELQGDPAGEINFNGVNQLNVDQRALLLHQVEEQLAQLAQLVQR